MLFPKVPIAKCPNPMSTVLSQEAGASGSGNEVRAIVGPKAETIPGPFELLGKIFSGSSSSSPSLPEPVNADTSKPSVDLKPLGILALLFSPLLAVQAFIFPNVLRVFNKVFGAVLGGDAPTGKQVLQKRGTVLARSPPKAGTRILKKSGTVGVKISKTRTLRTPAKKPMTKKIGAKKKGFF